MLGHHKVQCRQVGSPSRGLSMHGACRATWQYTKDTVPCCSYRRSACAKPDLGRPCNPAWQMFRSLPDVSRRSADAVSPPLGEVGLGACAPKCAKHDRAVPQRTALKQPIAAGSARLGHQPAHDRKAHDQEHCGKEQPRGDDHRLQRIQPRRACCAQQQHTGHCPFEDAPEDPL